LTTDEIVITTRVLGKRRQLLEDWSISYPPEFGEGGGPVTLRDFITWVVIESVRRFKKRQEHRRFIRVLSEKAIAEGAERGKIEMGGSDLEQEVNEDVAVGTALKAFEDGIYLVIIDGHEHKELDREIYLQPDSHVTFLRLVMLAGA
jgi:hypothetical protein